jgi:hypothetical protein
MREQPWFVRTMLDPAKRAFHMFECNAATRLGDQTALKAASVGGLFLVVEIIKRNGLSRGS